MYAFVGTVCRGMRITESNRPGTTLEPAIHSDVSLMAQDACVTRDDGDDDVACGGTPPEKTGVSRGPVQCSTPRTAPPMGNGVGRMASVRRRSLASTPGTLALSRYCPVSGFMSMSPDVIRIDSQSCWWAHAMRCQLGFLTDYGAGCKQPAVTAHGIPCKKQKLPVTGSICK